MIMSIAKTCAALSLAAAAILVPGADADAQTVRYVASFGDNANNCSREAPCRTLRRGIKKTPADGVLQILDSGHFGNAVLIDKSITISADGVSATVGAITIDGVGANIVLRGLMVNGRQVADGTPGILITKAQLVHILRCEIERFGDPLVAGTGDGILIDDPQGLAVVGVVIADSFVRHNGGSGIRVNGPVHVTVKSTTAAWNRESGYQTTAGGHMTLESSVAHGHFNGVGLRVAGFASVARISNSVITTNSIGLENAGGTLRSRRNNTVDGNSTNTVGTIDVLAGI